MNSSTLTLFTTMKPFRGEIARIQRNSIRSWLALKPCPEIIVFGDEPGVPEACREFGLVLVSDVERAPSGPPYVDDVFRKAQRLASARILCYVNSDILLTGDILTALDTVSRRLGPAVMASAVRNLIIPHELQTYDPCWEQNVRANACKGPAPTPVGADIFIFPRGFYGDLPSLAMGADYFDNMLLWRACFGSLPAVDLTDAVLAVHQYHHQTSHPRAWGYGPAQIVRGPSSEWKLAAVTVEYHHHHQTTYPWTSSCVPAQIARKSGSEWNHARTPWWQRHCWRIDLPFSLSPDGSIVRRRTIHRLAVLHRVTTRHCSALTRALLRRGARRIARTILEKRPTRTSRDTI